MGSRIYVITQGGGSSWPPWLNSLWDSQFAWNWQKMVLNTKFWSLPVHTYQKQTFLMIILAMRGQGKNLVIDRNSIVKKRKFEILTKTHVIYIKRKLRTCKIQIQVEKVWFVTKKLEKNNFQNFFFKGGTLWCRSGRKTFFRFFKFSKFFFWKMAPMGHNKCRKKQSHEIWAQSERPLRRHARYPSRGGQLDPPV